MSYVVAWIVALLVGCLGTVSVYFLTRELAPGWAKNMLRSLPGVLLLVPAPVPGFSGHFAPAFIVAIFEGLFQSNGRSLGASTILATTIVVTVALVLLVSYLSKPRSNREVSPN